jgi:hypothetical protein
VAPGDDAGCSDFVAAPSLIGSSICMNWPDYFNSWCVKKRVGILMANIFVYVVVGLSHSSCRETFSSEMDARTNHFLLRIWAPTFESTYTGDYS